MIVLLVGLEDEVATQLERGLADVPAEVVPVGAGAPAPQAAHLDVVVLRSAPVEIRPAVAEVRERVGDVPVIVVAGGDERHGVRRSLRAGADGYVSETDLERALAATVRAVAAGQVCVAKTRSTQLGRLAFSPRERQALALVAAGLSNKEIAERLYLSESTVKTHLTTGFRKLGVSCRAEAAGLLRDGTSLG